MRTHVNTEFLDKQGKQLLVANQEACVLSLENHRPQKLTELPYPKEDFPSPVYNEAFEKFPSDLLRYSIIFHCNGLHNFAVDTFRHKLSW